MTSAAAFATFIISVDISLGLLTDLVSLYQNTDSGNQTNMSLCGSTQHSHTLFQLTPHTHTHTKLNNIADSWMVLKVLLQIAALTRLTNNILYIQHTG